MFVDARSLPDGERLEADLCIIGAGAAGITLAREFIESGVRIVLLESGGFELESETQELYAGEVLGPHPVPDTEFFPLDESRLRFFGGSTNHWTGFCRPLDPIDFQERPYVPTAAGRSMPNICGLFSNVHMRFANSALRPIGSKIGWMACRNRSP